MDGRGIHEPSRSMEPIWGVGERWAGAGMRPAMEWMLIFEAYKRIDAALQRLLTESRLRWSTITGGEWGGRGGGNGGRSPSETGSASCITQTWIQSMWIWTNGRSSESNGRSVASSSRQRHLASRWQPLGEVLPPQEEEQAAEVAAQEQFNLIRMYIPPLRWKVEQRRLEGPRFRR